MKVIQITSTAVANTASTQCDYILHALTDEGSIWEMRATYGWVEVPGLPMPAPLLCALCGKTIAEHSIRGLCPNSYGDQRFTSKTETKL